MTTTATPATAVRTCWFEYTAESFIANAKRGYPNRIWSSTDPRWAEMEAKKETHEGRIIVAKIVRVGDEVIPRNYVPECVFRWSWERAMEGMRKFEREGRLWDNTLADQVAAEEQKAERAQSGLATAIASAIRDGNSGAKK